MLTSVRSLRHEILKAYVHNYIFDLGQIHAYNERVGKSGGISAPATINKPDTSVYIGDQPSTNNNPAETATTDSTDDTYNPNIMLNNIVADEIDVTEAERPAIKSSNRKSKKERGFNIALLIFIVLLLIGFGILAYYFVYLPLIGQQSVFSDGADNVITEILNMFTE
jgi:hypothetical protein